MGRAEYLSSKTELLCAIKPNHLCRVDPKKSIGRSSGISRGWIKLMTLFGDTSRHAGQKHYLLIGRPRRSPAARERLLLGLYDRVTPTPRSWLGQIHHRNVEDKWGVIQSEVTILCCCPRVVCLQALIIINIKTVLLTSSNHGKGGEGEELCSPDPPTKRYGRGGVEVDLE